MRLITPITKVREIYSDFRRAFDPSPLNNDILRNTNEEAVKESIRNLVTTNRGERLMQPNLGCDVRRLLFENIGPDTIITAKSMIKDTLEAYEPRANVISVDILGSLEGNSISVTIVFNLINKEDPVSLEFILDRIR